MCEGLTEAGKWNINSLINIFTALIKSFNGFM